jgi:hypothetical protein
MAVGGMPMQQQSQAMADPRDSVNDMPVPGYVRYKGHTAKVADIRYVPKGLEEQIQVLPI